MCLRFICIELRKNLHCANVFLQFEHSLTETEFLKINVEEDLLRLREYSTEISVPVGDFFTIEASTISNLTVEECNASFRLAIKFKENDDDSEEHSAGQKQQMDDIRPQLTPLLQENGSKVSIHCRNCESELCEQRSYQRIREFPSGSIDMSEFFCHHGPDFAEVLVPKENDFFYGFLFIVINAESMQKTTKEKENHVYCRRCLQFVGKTMFQGKAFKLWSDSVYIKTEDIDDFQSIFNLSTVSLSCLLLHKIIRETTLPTESESLLHQMQFSKVVLEATFPNRQRKHLLLHILEKRLPVLRNTQPLAVHVSSNNNNVQQVQLERCTSFKLLYRLVEEGSKEASQIAEDHNDADDEGGGGSSGKGDGGGGGGCGARYNGQVPPLLAYWQQDINIHSLEVSPSLFASLLRDLEDNSLLLPELYRYTRDDFQLSYVFSNH